MSAHVSDLQLDEIVAGLAEVPEHVKSCADCTKRVEQARAHAAAFLERPEAKAQLARLSRKAEGAPRRTVLRALAVALPLAAGLVFLVARPTQPEDRLKGAPAVMLLDATGTAVTHALAGQKLTLAVGAAGFSRVKITATDAQGRTESLFEGPIASGARVPLLELEVTPGDVVVNAEFEREGARGSASVKLEVP